MTPALQGQPPNLTLSEHQNWALVIALELEEAGWIGAARFLRLKYFPTVAWDDPAVKAVTQEGFQKLLRIHHGSLPPTPSPTVSPQPVKVQIRPDQTTA